MRAFPFLAVAMLLLGAWTVSAQVAGRSPPPAADAGPDRHAECSSPQGATVPLDAKGTRLAPNATNVSYAWVEDLDRTTERPLAEGPAANVTFPLGRHEVTLVVRMDALDEDGNRTTLVLTDPLVVEVVDTSPPTLQATASRTSLWPPNHKLVPVEVQVHVSDVCTPAPSWALAAVTSDEPANGQGDGSTAIDILDASPGTQDTRFLLRAERAGPGDGRAYALVYEARDASGNVARASALVQVPHDVE